MYDYINRASDPDNKVAVVVTSDEVLLHNQFNSNEKPQIVLKEHLFTAQIVFYFTKNSIFTDLFNDKISLLKSGGLIDYWTNTFMDPKFMRMDVIMGNEPKVLSYTQLEGAFELWLYSCVFSVVVFILEIFFFYKHKFYSSKKTLNSGIVF